MHRPFGQPFRGRQARTIARNDVNIMTRARERETGFFSANVPWILGVPHVYD